ncbi:MAG: IS1182 family transposase [Calditrichia bacterium]
MHYITPEDRHQFTFMQSLNDLVSSEHYVRLIDVIVDEVVGANKAQFCKKGKVFAGRKAYSPQTLLKLYIYGYLNGISSSRKLEKETQRNIEVIWLLGTLSPDHKTISDYRKDNGEEIKMVTRKFRQFLKDNGYIKGQTVATDGTRVKANAKRSMLTEKKIHRRLEKLEIELDEYLQRLSDNDIREDILEELDEIGESGDINEHLIDKIVELQGKIEELQKHKEELRRRDVKQLSPSDPESKLMKSPDGKVPGYNVQLTVDAKHKMIADSEVVNEPADRELLDVMLDSLEEELDIIPENALGDKGFFSFTKIEKVEGNGKTKCFVPIPRQKGNDESLRFIYDEENDEFRCSEGKRLVLKHKNKSKRGQLLDVYQGKECEGCAIREKCTSSKYGRIIHRAHNEAWRQEYRKRLQSRSGKKMVELRKCLVEHPIGTIRYWMGKIPLLLRGTIKVATEINLYTTAYNLRRLVSIESFTDLREMIGNYNWAIA